MSLVISFLGLFRRLNLTLVTIRPPKHEAMKMSGLECVFSYTANQRVRQRVRQNDLIVPYPARLEAYAREYLPRPVYVQQAHSCSNLNPK